MKFNQNEENIQYVAKIHDLLFTQYKNPLAYVRSFGCQQNMNDGEKLKGILSQLGYGLTTNIKEADLVLYNTCAVREGAQDRVFGNIGALSHEKRRKPGMLIGVCGCMTQQDIVSERIKQSYPHVDIVFGTSAFGELPGIIYKALTSKKRTFIKTDENGEIIEGVPISRESKLSANIPVMYGCNNYCSYCIVPYVRGRERSRSSVDIIGEISGLISSGYKHFTLLGQNVNSYGVGLSENINFSELLKRINDLEGEFRVSFMTSHPKDATKELIDTIKSCEKISRHLHLPIQSGSNRILNLMNRKYTAEKYMDIIEYARENISDISLTSDIIVGFPGESYEDFRETLEIVEKVRYDGLFTFIYSERSGTKAADMPDYIHSDEKNKWFGELLELQAGIEEKQYERYTGMKVKVLCDGKGRGEYENYISGRSEHNIIVNFNGNDSMLGNFTEVRITKPLRKALVGEIINK